MNEALDAPGTDYERGFIDGMQEQMKRSVDQAVKAMTGKREWVGLTDEEMRQSAQSMDAEPLSEGWKELIKFARAIEAKLKEKNNVA